MSVRRLPRPRGRSRGGAGGLARAAGLAIAVVGVVAVVGALGVGGCAGTNPARDPFAQRSERELRESIIAEAQRTLADAKSQPLPVVTTRQSGVDRLRIRPDIMPELERMAGPASYAGEAGELVSNLGMDLTGRPVRAVTINLERAVKTSVRNNLAVQFAQLNPAVGEAQLQAAEAAFDWTLFASLNAQRNDTPAVSINNSAGVNDSTVISGGAGLRRQLIGGGRFTLQTDQSRTDNNTPAQNANPDPAFTTSVTAQWDQPLLRNFGSDTARAEVRLAANQARENVQLFHRDLIRTASDVERAYWELVRARADVLILQRLLERGEQVRRQLVERAQIDANSAQIADATSRVERRRADVLRAQTTVQLASDRLKQLMNDPQLPAGSELVVLPSDAAVDEPVQFSLLESLRTAITSRPEVVQAIINIDDASIRQAVADNQRLPQLDLRLQTRFSDLSRNWGDSMGDTIDGRFIDMLAGLSLEAPIGNRRAEAALRQRRLERMQSVLAYRNTVQQVVGEVKSALQRVKLNYTLIEQTRTSRVAASENVRVLLVEKDQGLGFTVERLNIELNSQEQLAASEREEAGALVDYNIALTDLFAAMGTTLERNNIAFVLPGVEETLGQQSPPIPAELVTPSDWPGDQPSADAELEAHRQREREQAGESSGSP